MSLKTGGYEEFAMVNIISIDNKKLVFWIKMRKSLVEEVKK